MRIKVKRIYASADDADGLRILVDRIWPRGVSKDKAGLDHWFKGVAPSTELRKWFGHDKEKWLTFQERFFAELNAAPDAVAQLQTAIGSHTATLLYAAKDETHNNAVALKTFLEKDG